MEVCSFSYKERLFRIRLDFGQVMVWFNNAFGERQLSPGDELASRH